MADPDATKERKGREMNSPRLQYAFEIICRCQVEEPESIPCTMVVGKNTRGGNPDDLMLVTASGSVIRSLVDAGYALHLTGDGIQVEEF